MVIVDRLKLDNDTYQKTIEMLRKEKDNKDSHIETLSKKIKIKDKEIKDTRATLIKKEEENNKDLVDKKFISSFLVNFFDVQSSEKVKAELLETLASLLDLCEEDRVRVGLNKIKANKINKSGNEEERRNSDLKTMFLDFLKHGD